MTLKWVFNLASLNNEVIQQPQKRNQMQRKKTQKIPISDAIRAR